MAPVERIIERQNRVNIGVKLQRGTLRYLEVIGEGNISLGIEKLVGTRPLEPEYLRLLRDLQSVQEVVAASSNGGRGSRSRT